eukprot:6210785-Pleurochrysis_carterae.AAC.3
MGVWALVRSLYGAALVAAAISCDQRRLPRRLRRLWRRWVSAGLSQGRKVPHTAEIRVSTPEIRTTYLREPLERMHLLPAETFHSRTLTKAIDRRRLALKTCSDLRIYRPRECSSSGIERRADRGFASVSV